MSNQNAHSLEVTSGFNQVQWLLLSCILISVFFLNWKILLALTQKIMSHFPKLKALFVIAEPPKPSQIKIGEVMLTDEDRMRHTHILGASGYGKSVLIDNMVRADIERGRGMVIIDAKGERSSYDRVKEICHNLGRSSDLHLLSASHLQESSKWNPCRLGSEAELVSKFYCSSKYDHTYYAKAAEAALIYAFRALKSDEVKSLNFRDVVRALFELTKGGADESTKGLYYDFFNLAQGEWAAVLGLKEKVGIQKEISVLDVVRKNEILYVDLPTEGKLVQSSRIGALILQELTLVSGIRKRTPALIKEDPFSVYVDEFDAFATPSFATFLNKGRSSGFMIHLAHQTLSDLKKISDTFQGQVTGNCSNQFVFRLNDSDDADKMCRDFGTVLTKKQTHQTEDGALSGKGTEREVQEFKIHPDVLKTLPVGSCVVSIKSQDFLKVIKVPFGGELKKIPLPLNRECLGLVVSSQKLSSKFELMKE